MDEVSERYGAAAMHLDRYEGVLANTKKLVADMIRSQHADDPEMMKSKSHLTAEAEKREREERWEQQAEQNLRGLAAAREALFGRAA